MKYNAFIDSVDKLHLYRYKWKVKSRMFNIYSCFIDKAYIHEPQEPESLLTGNVTVLVDHYIKSIFLCDFISSFYKHKNMDNL